MRMHATGAMPTKLPAYLPWYLAYKPTALTLNVPACLGTLA